MKKFILAIPALLLLASFGPITKTKTYNYEVLLDGRPIGTYMVNRTEWNDTENFKVETVTAAGLIRRSEHRFEMLSAYENEQLISSDITTWVNDKFESSSIIHWDGSQYIRQEGERISEICNEMVTYSSACVYFEEPVGRTSFFYEKYGVDLEVSAIGNHQYEVKLPNGGIERYTYDNNEVVRVEFVQSFATITLEKSVAN